MQIRENAGPSAPYWSPRWWGLGGRWLALAAPLLVFAAQWAPAGAALSKPAFTLALAAAILLGLSLFDPALRRDLNRIRGLTTPAAAFGLALLVIVWSLTPWAPGGPHPVWDYAGVSPPASTVDKSRTLTELFKLLGLAAVFALGLGLGSSDDRARLTAGVIAVFAGGLALWSLIAFAADPLGAGGLRLGAPFRMPNPAATMFGALLMAALGVTVSRARAAPPQLRFSKTAPAGGLALLILVAVLATASRGGFVATALGLVAFIALLTFGGAVKLSRAAVLSLGGLLLAAAALGIFGDRLLDRLATNAWDADGRRLLFQMHWEAFKAAPLMGYGLGTFDTVHRMVTAAASIQSVWTAAAAHNVYLNWLEQAGLFGALPMFTAIGAVLALTVRNALRRTRLKPILFGLLAASVVVLVHGASDFALELYSIAMLWSLLLGLGFSAAQGSSVR